MLYLTESSRGRSHKQPRVKGSRSQTASASIPKNGNSASDGVKLTTRARQTAPTNPYDGIAPSSSKVKVGKWGSGDNDSLYGILRSQNYSRDEIFKKDENGKNLLDRVSQVNNLRDPNLIRVGQDLVVPSKDQPKTEQKPQSGIHEVKVGKWGRDKSGSLYGILSEQGYSRKEILGDGGNNSLLNRVARANGLESPDKIREGQTLKIPGSTEALNELDPQREQLKKLEVLKPQPIQIENKPVEMKPIEVKPVTPVEVQPKPVEDAKPAEVRNERVTANMGLLLDGVKEGKFKKDEFQYLNALSNRYEETRAQFSKDGFNNDELKALGKFETNYGVTYTRLYNSDDVRLTNATNGSATTEKGQLRVRHYQEGGELWDGFNSGTINTEQAISKMVQQREEARAQGVK